ncbi:MAG: acyl-ACP--UDP-N-acetylglucosamine O-acyltransferase [Pyrinomonadaceae bacterium]|nr:acyl-ACP--UDP-N-acetylglucosamine O-acyltransferase [Pyrinomonadaceae bacterium]MCX7639153.1 acyl-ACP--UDP-N-acetylglucosamine O-acyltransferase [Pyrinomonadaceae bacterium]MDW8303626.1 acyl-ACP--UDP-N-acetylglucosamine O-acyltransferase [Acidobacteriota bacterium]
MLKPKQVFIHETAIVSPKAIVGSGCYIGPYSVIGDGVILGERVRVESHVVIDGETEIGDETHIFPFVSIGLAPQDLKYKGERTKVIIGKRNQIREFVTIHKGTENGGGVTFIGNDNLLMAQAHVAHDCTIGNKVIMANGATLAGHVIIEDGATVGAYSGVHQFCRVGREAFIGGYSVIVKDAPPFAICQGNHAKCYGLNIVGMKRRNYPKQTIDKLHRAYRLFLKLNTTQALERIKTEITDCPEVELLVNFIETSKRGVIK